MKVKDIAQLIKVISSPMFGDDYRVEKIESEEYDFYYQSGVRLAKWSEPHGRGFTEREVRVPYEKVPQLVIALVEYYEAETRARAKLAQKKAS